MAPQSDKDDRKRTAPSKKSKSKPKKAKIQAEEPQPPSLSEEDLQKLLDPYSKDQLISFLSEAALQNPSLLSKIQSIADRDVSHRKIFVHGLSWDTSSDDLRAVFSPFGPIEECNAILDKLIGRAKGFGFVLFSTRAAADAALKEPQKKVKSRMVSCQLASIGPVSSHGGGAQGVPDTTGRKLYVSNVHADAAPDKLRELFEKFGEIEMGPLGYDTATGKSRGFALFIYKNAEGLNKALEEPYKMFDGHQLQCRRAMETGKGKGFPGGVAPAAAGAASIRPAVLASQGAGALGASSQQVLAAVAAAQNLALCSQNPAYAALLAQNPLVAAAVNQAALNPAALAALNPAGASGLGALGASSPLLGTYGAQGAAGLQGTQYGQSHLGRPTGSYGGPSSLFW